MKRLYWLLMLSLLTGCTMMLSEATPPDVRQVTVPTSLDVTYDRALRAANKMGGVLLAQDTAQYTFTVKVKHVVGLHVDVRRVATGTQMTVTGTILPQQLAIGTMSAVDEFLVAYRMEQL